MPLADRIFALYGKMGFLREPLIEPRIDKRFTKDGKETIAQAVVEFFG